MSGLRIEGDSEEATLVDAISKAFLNEHLPLGGREIPGPVLGALMTHDAEVPALTEA